MKSIKEFQNQIGYSFQNGELLLQALTHSSYANEHKMRKHMDNERLEFLGDAVLEVVSSEYLYRRFPEMPEGELTKMRASIVCEQSLAFLSRKLELGDYLRLGKGERMTGGANRPSVLSDAFEAVIGAVYLDGGFAVAREYVEKHVMQHMDHMKLFFDSKTLLQEYVQGGDLGAISYVLLNEHGPDHNKSYDVAVQIGETRYGQGSGHTKKAAEQEAAYHTLLTLRGV